MKRAFRTMMAVLLPLALAASCGGGGGGAGSGGGGGGGGGGGEDEPATVSSVSRPSPATVAAGYFRQLTAIATYSDGATKNVTAAASWTSSDDAMVQVGGAGLASGVAPGSVLVTAAFSGVSGSAVLAVRDPPRVRLLRECGRGGCGRNRLTWGELSRIGPATGSGMPIDTATGKPSGVFPKVNGYVTAVAPDGTGGWFIGGSFTRVGGVAGIASPTSRATAGSTTPGTPARMESSGPSR